jgi:endonuclease YncB( thermonuclease family)
VQWLICILFVICALGFYGYKYWNAPPPTAIISKAWVIDGDTVVISGTHIRLEGIDAPETDQICTDASPGPVGGPPRAARVDSRR